MSAAGVFITAAAFIFPALPFGFSLIITVIHHVSETPSPPQGFCSAQVFTFALAFSCVLMSQRLLFLFFSFSFVPLSADDLDSSVKERCLKPASLARAHSRKIAAQSSFIYSPGPLWVLHVDQQWQENLALNREKPQAGPDSCRGQGPIIPAITGRYSAVNLYCAYIVMTFVTFTSVIITFVDFIISNMSWCLIGA